MTDLQTGAELHLANLPPRFDIREFDISPDGRGIRARMCCRWIFTDRETTSSDRTRITRKAEGTPLEMGTDESLMSRSLASWFESGFLDPPRPGKFATDIGAFQVDEVAKIPLNARVAEALRIRRFAPAASVSLDVDSLDFRLSQFRHSAKAGAGHPE